jgi:hypothetical protein
MGLGGGLITELDALTQISAMGFGRLAVVFSRIRSAPLAPASVLQEPIKGGRSRRWRFRGAQSKSASNRQNKDVTKSKLGTSRMDWNAFHQGIRKERGDGGC